MSILENINGYDKDYSKDLTELLPQNWKQANSKLPLNVLRVFTEKQVKTRKNSDKEL